MMVDWTNLDVRKDAFQRYRQGKVTKEYNFSAQVCAAQSFSAINDLIKQRDPPIWQVYPGVRHTGDTCAALVTGCFLGEGGESVIQNTQLLVYWDPFEFPRWKNHQEVISFQRLSPSYPCGQPQPEKEVKVMDTSVVGTTPKSGDKNGKSSLRDNDEKAVSSPDKAYEGFELNDKDVQVGDVGYQFFAKKGKVLHGEDVPNKEVVYLMEIVGIDPKSTSSEGAKRQIYCQEDSDICDRWFGMKLIKQLAEVSKRDYEKFHYESG
jgi:hypothetical protein